MFSFIVNSDDLIWTTDLKSMLDGNSFCC